MREDRGARRNRGNRSGLCLLAALAVAALLLIVAVMLKSGAERLRAQQESEAAHLSAGEVSSTVSPHGTQTPALPNV